MRNRGMGLNRQWKGIEITHLDNFRLASEDTFDFGSSECFDPEVEVLAFFAGIGHDFDERAPVKLIPYAHVNPSMCRLLRR